MINILVASDPRGVIGKGDSIIPWYLPEDLKLFKLRTMGSSIIMGRKTFDSLPKKPLPGRINYVISHTVPEETLGAIWCTSFEEAIEKAKKDEKEIYIIGGEQIYKLALESGLVDRIILSRLHDEYEGDRYFNIPADWLECNREEYDGFDVIHFLKVKDV